MDLRIPVETQTDPELLLILAKAGYGPALVRLLDRYRLVLEEQVRGQVGRRSRVKNIRIRALHRLRGMLGDL